MVATKSLIVSDLIKFLHEAGLMPGSVIGMNDTLFCRFIQGTNCLRYRSLCSIQFLVGYEPFCFNYTGLGIAADGFISYPLLGCNSICLVQLPSLY